MDQCYGPRKELIFSVFNGGKSQSWIQSVRLPIFPVKFRYFFQIDGRFRIRSQIWIRSDNNGSESGTPKTDPEHWFLNIRIEIIIVTL